MSLFPLILKVLEILSKDTSHLLLLESGGANLDFVLTLRQYKKKQERLYTPPNRVWEEKGMVQVKDIFKDPKLLGSSSYQMFGTIRSSQKHVLNDF